MNRLADAVAKRLMEMEQARRSQALKETLFGRSGSARLSDHYAFSFDPNVYPARWPK